MARAADATPGVSPFDVRARGNLMRRESLVVMSLITSMACSDGSAANVGAQTAAGASAAAAGAQAASPALAGAWLAGAGIGVTDLDKSQ